MNSSGARSSSLAARVVLIFAIGSAVIMSAAGYALYHALAMQHEANDAANIADSTQAVRDILRGVDSRAKLGASLDRLKDLTLGHRYLDIGVRLDDRWLFAPAAGGLADAKTEAAAHSHGDTMAGVHLGRRSWLVQHVHHALARDGGHVDVLLAVETTATHELLRRHAILAALFAAFGTLLSALLGWFAVRRGLAPVAQLAARAEEVTAQRLDDRLDLSDAPRELNSLADSINRMLRRLEESFGTLEQFSADIAHELRTPLNNLLLQTQVTLSRKRTAQEYEEALHSNLEELERLQRMVSEMLFLARAERGMIELRQEDVDLRAEAESVVDYFEAAASEKGQALQITGAARGDCDRSLVRRAITNLVSNAVRYAPDGARILVRLSEDGPGPSIAVTNPAPAIGGPELKRLFVRFARRDESRSRETEGAGLGLAIVDSIMKLQGGRVEVVSGEGSLTFLLLFRPSRATA